MKNELTDELRIVLADLTDDAPLDDWKTSRVSQGFESHSYLVVRHKPTRRAFKVLITEETDK